MKYRIIKKNIKLKEKLNLKFKKQRELEMYPNLIEIKPLSNRNGCIRI